MLRQAERRLQKRTQRLADERSHLEALLAHERAQLEQQRAETLMLEQQVPTLLCSQCLKQQVVETLMLEQQVPTLMCFQCFQQQVVVMRSTLACSGTLLRSWRRPPD